jgi:hypothetical protein
LPETVGDLVELVALENLSRSDTFCEPAELGQSRV